MRVEWDNAMKLFTKISRFSSHLWNTNRFRNYLKSAWLFRFLLNVKSFALSLSISVGLIDKKITFEIIKFIPRLSFRASYESPFAITLRDIYFVYRSNKASLVIHFHSHLQRKFELFEVELCCAFNFCILRENGR